MNRIVRYTEVGLYSNLREKFEEHVLLYLEAKLYTKVQTLKNEFVKISNLNMDYFEKLLIYLYACNSLLLLLMLLRNGFKFLLRKVKRLKVTVKWCPVRIHRRLTIKLPVIKIKLKSNYY